MRPIHSLPTDCPLKPTMRFVKGLVKDYLNNIQLLANGTPDLLRKVMANTDPEDSMFAKLGIQEYDTGNDHDMMVDQSSEMLPDTWRERYKAMLRFILKSQGGRGEHEDGYSWRVVGGSGHTIVGAGDVSDAAMFALVEQNWVGNAKAVTSKYGLEGCFRFRDGVLLLIYGSFSQRRVFLEECHEEHQLIYHCWKVRVKEVSHTRAHHHVIHCFCKVTTVLEPPRWHNTSLAEASSLC